MEEIDGVRSTIPPKLGEQGTTLAFHPRAMKVRLTKKYAERIDGVDLAGLAVGESFDLPEEKARLLVAEKWAMPERRREGAAPQCVEGRRAAD